MKIKKVIIVPSIVEFDIKEKKLTLMSSLSLVIDLKIIDNDHRH